MQILQVLTNEVQYFKGDDTKLWGIISKHEYRRCAVTECYESIKHILLRRLLKVDSQEHKIIESVFKEIDASIAHDRFTTSFVLQKILIVHDRVVKLIAVLMTKPTGGNIRKVHSLLARMLLKMESLIMIFLPIIPCKLSYQLIDHLLKYG